MSATSVDTTLTEKEKCQRLGSALAECESLLKDLNLPSMFTSMISHANAFFEAEGCDEETLSPFDADTMNDVIELARNDNDKYRQIITKRFHERDHEDETSTLNRMQAAISFVLLTEKLKPVYEEMCKPNEDEKPGKKRKVEQEAEVDKGV